MTFSPTVLKLICGAHGHLISFDITWRNWASIENHLRETVNDLVFDNTAKNKTFKYARECNTQWRIKIDSISAIVYSKVVGE